LGTPKQIAVTRIGVWHTILSVAYIFFGSTHKLMLAVHRHIIN